MSLLRLKKIKELNTRDININTWEYNLGGPYHKTLYVTDLLFPSATFYCTNGEKAQSYVERIGDYVLHEHTRVRNSVHNFYTRAIPVRVHKMFYSIESSISVVGFRR